MNKSDYQNKACDDDLKLGLKKERAEPKFESETFPETESKSVKNIVALSKEKAIKLIPNAFRMFYL